MACNLHNYQKTIYFQNYFHSSVKARILFVSQAVGQACFTLKFIIIAGLHQSQPFKYFLYCLLLLSPMFFRKLLEFIPFLLQNIIIIDLRKNGITGVSSLNFKLELLGTLVGQIS